MAKEDKWLPTDGEIAKLHKEHNWLIFSHELYRLNSVAQLTAKKIHDEGNKPCPHAGSINGQSLLNKRECSTCWQSLREVE